MTSKNCTKCNIEKPLFEFSLRKETGNYRPVCKMCRVKDTQKLFRSKNGLSIQIYADQTKVSRRRNHPAPSYTRLQLRDWLLIQPNYDELHTRWVDSGYARMKVPSCDRLNDYKPYTFDNLQLISWEDNKQKSHDDAKTGRNRKLSKSVIQMTLDRSLIKVHHSAKHAGRVTGAGQGSISRCCNAKSTDYTAGGFRWMYEIII